MTAEQRYTPSGVDEKGAFDLTQDFLDALWRDIYVSGQMVGTCESPGANRIMLMATAFGDSLENALYFQPMDGETLFEEADRHQVVFARRRSEADMGWSKWVRRADGYSPLNRSPSST